MSAPRFGAAVLASTLLLCFAPVRAEPVGNALDKVPDGTAICVVVRDLRTQLRALADSPFLAWFKESSLGRRILDPKELEKLKVLHDFFAEQLGVTGDQLLDDVVGDAVVLAYKPGPPGKPDDETGVILVAPRKPELLARLIDKLNELQQKSGEIRAVREIAYKDHTLYEREKATGAREYYQLHDGVFAFSGQLKGLHGVIDRAVAKAPGSSNVRASLMELGLDNRLAVCWFNPRSFDADLQQKEVTTKDAGERAFLTQFRKVWSATELLALDLHVQRGIELGVVAKFEPTRLPVELRDLILQKPGPSKLATRIPPDAMLAITGRFDLPKIVAALGALLPPDGKAGLTAMIEQFVGPLIGKDKLASVIAGIGPDWGVWLSAPPTATKAWAPEWTMAVKLADANAKPVLSAIEFTAQSARISYNRDHADQIDFQEETADQTAIKFFVNDVAFPTGFRPAFAVAQGYFIVASTPETVRKFLATAEREAGETPLLRLSGSRLKAYLAAHATELAGFLAKTQKRAVADIERELKDLTMVLEAFDKLEIHRTTTEKTVRFSVQVQLTKPLAK